MKDYLDQELAVGDFVIFMQQHYRKFGLAKVTKFTKTKVRVKWGESQWSELLQAPDQLVKVTGEEVFAYALKHGVTF